MSVQRDRQGRTYEGRVRAFASRIWKERLNEVESPGRLSSLIFHSLLSTSSYYSTFNVWMRKINYLFDRAPLHFGNMTKNLLKTRQVWPGLFIQICLGSRKMGTISYKPLYERPGIFLLQ